MTFDTALFVSAFATLFVIIDPPGNLPIFLALTSKASERNRRRIAFQANFIAGILLLLFGFFGFSVFNALGISAPALQLSGGLLLLLIALQLLTGQEQDPGESDGDLHVAMVPLGMPLLAGPGSIVAFMLLIDEAGHDWMRIVTTVLGLICVLSISWLTMRFANPILKLLGESGIMLLTRLSGMLLAAIAAQLMINGIVSVVNTHFGG
ncbi:membrane protein, MarC family [Arcanobacterium haemolyticum]|uniref:MarC family protein n=1 Tax=Arcanobacterium haemolyticum TaxID=28264 RepID=UPI000D8AD3CB|nr:MarC family protein [Arcanobacterium haemolyticum]SPT75597.1 membrane protein, MarC family [Arcanobacterium haemolyticum]